MEMAARPQRQIRARVVVVLLLLALTVGAARGATLPSPWALVRPGPTSDVIAALSGDIVDPEFGTSGGQLLMTTVWTEDLSWGGWLKARYRPPEDATIEPASRDLDGSEPDPAVYRAQMEASKQAALLAAWDALGNTAPLTRVSVVRVEGGAADAAGPLRVAV